jgi:hypothetical protein
LAREHGLAEITSLATVAEQIGIGNSFMLIDYLSRELDTFDKQPKHIHRLIVRIPFTTIVTTTYDDLLERAFQEAHKLVGRIVQPDDIPFVGTQQPTIIKLYGELRQRKTLVVTQTDHTNQWLDPARRPILDAVQSVLRGNAALFIGHNLADPDFLLLWQSIVRQHGSFTIGAYAVVPGLPATDQRIWQERHIRFLEAQPLDVLERLTTVLPSPPSMPAEESIPAPPPRAEYKLSDDDITEQLALLQAHRRTLAAYLQREAIVGSAHVPPEVSSGIYQARSEIRRIKAVLLASGVPIDEHPND